jgi:nucleotide-binding universal stress UspA family protein
VAAERSWEEEIKVELEGALTNAAETAKRVCDTRIETHARFGSPAEVLCDLAAHLGADLIVVGNKGMQGGRRFLGSVPNTVSHHAPCSVLIVDTQSDDDPSS